MMMSLVLKATAALLLQGEDGQTREEALGDQPTAPIYLSVENFLADRFELSIEPVIAAIRANLAPNYPDEPIDWATAELKIVRVGEPTLNFSNVTWGKVGETARSFSAAAVEAYFNCTAQPQERNLNQIDVVTKEAEEVRTRSRNRTDRVKKSLTLTYTPPSVGFSGFSSSGGLGGDASKEWERTITESETYQNITKETVQSTWNLTENFNISPYTLRYNEYSEQVVQERWFVWARPLIDVAIAVKYRVPKEEEFWETRVMSGAGNMPNGIQTVRRIRTVQEERTRDAGRWRMFVGEDERTLTSAANLQIEKTTVFSGPIDVVFPDSRTCLQARRDMEKSATDIESLTEIGERLVEQNPATSVLTYDTQGLSPPSQLPLSLASLTKTSSKIVIPAVDGQVIQLKPDALQQVEFRAKSMGPGFCSVIAGLGSDVVNIAAPPLSWSSWARLPTAHSGGAFSIRFSPQCDTGAVGEIRYSAP